MANQANKIQLDRGSKQTLSPLLSTRAIADRYGFGDLRAARALIQTAGGFKHGNRWLLRQDDLDSWERNGSPVRIHQTPSSANPSHHACSTSNAAQSSAELPHNWHQETEQ